MGGVSKLMHPPEFDFACFFYSEAISKAIYHSLGFK